MSTNSADVVVCARCVQGESNGAGGDDGDGVGGGARAVRRLRHFCDIMKSGGEVEEQNIADPEGLTGCPSDVSRGSGDGCGETLTYTVNTTKGKSRCFGFTRLDSIHFPIASESHSPAMPPIIPINRTSENSIWVLRFCLCSSSSSGSVSGRTGSGPRSAVTVNNHSGELSVESLPTCVYKSTKKGIRNPMEASIGQNELRFIQRPNSLGIGCQNMVGISIDKTNEHEESWSWSDEVQTKVNVKQNCFKEFLSTSDAKDRLRKDTCLLNKKRRKRWIWPRLSHMRSVHEIRLKE
ncbi:hypothetical protein LXL04_002702 [Taraxacum kok-saghyz]